MPQFQTVIVEKIVEKIVEVDKTVMVPHIMPEYAHFTTQADAFVIAAEVALAGPSAAHMHEFKEKVVIHETKYPNGTLPRELWSFDDYMNMMQHRLNRAENASLKCLRCGKFPWS